jgi:hypothetical protein
MRSQIYFTLTAKRLEMMHELMGRASIALLVNPTNPYTESETRVVQATAGALGLQLRVLNATSERDLATVFAAIAEMRAAFSSTSSPPRAKRLISLVFAPRACRPASRAGLTGATRPTANGIKHVARSMPADGLEAQDVVPPSRGCLGCSHIVAAIGYSARKSQEALPDTA